MSDSAEERTSCKQQLELCIIRESFSVAENIKWPSFNPKKKLNLFICSCKPLALIPGPPFSSISVYKASWTKNNKVIYISNSIVLFM